MPHILKLQNQNRYCLFLKGELLFQVKKYNPNVLRELHNQLNLFMGRKHGGQGAKLASDIMQRILGMISLLLCRYKYLFPFKR